MCRSMRGVAIPCSTMDHGQSPVSRIRTVYLFLIVLVMAAITIILQISNVAELKLLKPKVQFSKHDDVRDFPADVGGNENTNSSKSAGGDALGIIAGEVDETRPRSSSFACHNDTTPEIKIAVFGGIKIIKQWQELSILVNSFKLTEPNTYILNVTCPYQRTTPRLLIEEGVPVACETKVTVTLTASMNILQGKDIVVLGMSPYSLKIKTKVMRTKISGGQLFVFYGVETPLRMHEWIPDVGRQPVHGVWSYTSTSDTVIPYGRYVEFDTEIEVDVNELVSSKNKLVAWMGSNCVKQVFWPRMAFVNELQKYVQVDTYGKCGNLTCLPRMSKRCQSLMGEYKFYLSLENAECRDYMTEKFWDTALIQGAVPVVYGAKKSDYERVAPPNSFIHVSDFDSVESLAKYLLLLDRNDVLYSRFFHWRRKGEIEMVFPPLLPSSFCDIIQQYYLLQRGMVNTVDLAKTSWFQGCRYQVAKSYPSQALSGWKPWR